MGQFPLPGSMSGQPAAPLSDVLLSPGRLATSRAKRSSERTARLLRSSPAPSASPAIVVNECGHLCRVTSSTERWSRTDALRNEPTFLSGPPTDWSVS